MAKVTLKGTPVSTFANLPETGTDAPDFKFVKRDLSEITLKDCEGKRIVLNIFPSIDTPTCAMSVRQFNKKATDIPNTTVICVSADLPFAAQRFCGAEGIENVETGSVFRYPEFGKDYGVEFTTGPLAGLLSRAVVVIDKEGKVIYTQQVPEIADEPNYDSVLKALKE
ncbi:MAG: thiol peroxidase [Victivallales bacterium]|nr:thiol peroxidase [Victivallales bacterium]